MDGLECSEIQLIDLENNITIGAEYYAKHYVETLNKVKKCEKINTLGKISNIITDGDHGSPDYQENGVMMFLSESIQEGYINFSKIRYITEEKNNSLKRSELHPNDVVITKTGVYYGKSAVIPKEVKRANTTSHVCKIELKQGYNPYFVSTFFNSNFGYSQLRRRGLKATRPEMALLEFPDLLVPKFSNEFEHLIEEAINRSNKIMTQANAEYAQAEKLLEQEIGIDISKITDENISVKSFTQSFGKTNRLDAEYYQPKYDELIKIINKKLKGTIKNLCNIYDNNYMPEDNRYYQYIELANIGKSSDIEGVESVIGQELPTRARRLVKKGQVIVSSIEGSLESCAMITSNYGNALCSTGFYVIDSDYYNSETLLVLLKSHSMQMLLKRGCSGSILTNISKDEFLNIPLPEISTNTQNQIKEKITKVYSLRFLSKQLLTYAKEAVEIAIEKNENEAINCLKDKMSE